MATRDFAALQNRTFDLLVVGGGINGAGLARDASLRGLSVALVEKGDYAAGTSSQSSKLIHGGIRYLQHGDFKLVFEACQERWILTLLAGHIVRPLKFLLPIYRTDPVPAWQMKIGLTLYDALAGLHNIHPHRMLRKTEIQQAEPDMNHNDLNHAAFYYDCQMNDSRLCLENVLSAREKGAVCLNYAEVVAFHKTEGLISGATVRDRVSDQTVEVRARTCVNATGPWSDRLVRLSGDFVRPRLRPSKGVHLVVPPLTQGEALLVRSGSDERVIFLLPWGRYSLVGTTETEYTGDPDHVRADDDDIAYLLKESKKVFPAASLSRSDVFATFAGIRPLVDASSAPAGSLSREHSILRETSGMLTVIGGKYTTYRIVARDLADRVVEQLGIPGRPRCSTQVEPLWGGDLSGLTIDAYVQKNTPAVASALNCDEGRAGGLINRYGCRFQEVVEFCQKTPAGAEPLCSHTDHLVGEVAYAFERELAVSVPDFFLRRTWIGYGPCRGEDAWPKVRRVLCDFLRFDATRVDAEWTALQEQQRLPTPTI